MAYAHAVIEVPRDDDVVVYNRGDEVPDDLPGMDELREFGSIQDEPYDPANEPKQVPDYVEIDGVRYAKVNSDAE